MDRPRSAALAAILVLLAGCGGGAPVGPAPLQVSLTLTECLFRSSVIKDMLAPSSVRPLELVWGDGAGVSSSCDAATTRLADMGATAACVNLGRVNTEVGAETERLFAAAASRRNEAALKAAIGQADAAARACPAAGA